ncbi:hypothetical protein [Lactobacillus crispatus]|nr:hypothetical protein [Lactobacillus crispatus]
MKVKLNIDPSLPEEKAEFWLKKHTNLVLDHESTDSRSGTFYFV